MTRIETDGHVAAILVTEPHSASAADVGTVHLLGTGGETLTWWEVAAPRPFRSWCDDLVAGAAEGQITDGAFTMVVRREHGGLVLALYEPWVDDEPSLLGLFSADPDVVVTGSTGAT